ncbi:hypothetical protein BGX38DRAFT_1143056 [Terfezia claveryi]|nr:hypothetical protein BGX38DRAFT_1143056 [Terfezia claveryi]
MSVKEVPVFLIYFQHDIETQILNVAKSLQEPSQGLSQEPSRQHDMFSTFEDADTFLRKAIGRFLKANIAQHGSFRELVIREGLHVKDGVIQSFFKLLSQLRQKRRTLRRNLLHQTGLSLGSQTTNTSIRVIYVWKLHETYPPMGYWVAESPEIFEEWEQYLKTYKLADRQHARFPTMCLNTAKLQVDIAATESVIIRDADSNDLMGVVIRNFSNDRGLVTWATEILDRSTEIAKSIRLDDPRKICLQGWSPGQLSNPRFDWVKNMTKVLENDELMVYHNNISGVFAVA